MIGVEIAGEDGVVFGRPIIIEAIRQQLTEKGNEPELVDYKCRVHSFYGQFTRGSGPGRATEN